MSPDLLRVERAGFRYEDSDWELAEISFSLRPGEMLAIIGPNGSGKSTLLRLAAGVLSPSRGRVFLQGRQVSALDRREVARTLGYLPQQVHYAFDYTVEEVVGHEIVQRYGGQVVLAPMQATYSTSELVRKIRELEENGT